MRTAKCLWDHYWEHAGQLLYIFSLSLVTVPEVFAKVNSASFSFLKWQIGFPNTYPPGVSA